MDNYRRLPGTMREILEKRTYRHGKAALASGTRGTILFTSEPMPSISHVTTSPSPRKHGGSIAKPTLAVYRL